MGVLVLDDRDAAVLYSTGWGQGGGGSEFNTTTTHTNTVGATARVTFYGTKITVYGTIAGSLTRKPTSSYAIDAGTPTTFEGNPGLVAKFNQVFYESPDLPAAEHTLTITNTGSDASLFLDLFMVNPPDTPMVTTVTTTATPAVVTSARTVTMTMTGSGSGQPSGATAGSSGDSNVGAAQKSSNNTAAIAGGIIGALALLVLLVGGFLFYRKRKRQMSASSTSAYDWNTKGSAPAGPPTPLAPQFQAAGWGQPQMAQNTGGSYTPYGETRQYSPSTYTTGGGYPATPAQQYAPPSTAYTQQPSSAYSPQNPLPPLPAQQPSSELAYYSGNDVGDPYGGYEQQGPYPPPHQPPANQNMNPSTGRVRVNLDG